MHWAVLAVGGGKIHEVKTERRNRANLNREMERGSEIRNLSSRGKVSQKGEGRAPVNGLCKRPGSSRGYNLRNSGFGLTDDSHIQVSVSINCKKKPCSLSSEEARGAVPRAGPSFSGPRSCVSVPCSSSG